MMWIDSFCTKTVKNELFSKFWEKCFYCQKVIVAVNFSASRGFFQRRTALTELITRKMYCWLEVVSSTYFITFVQSDVVAKFIAVKLLIIRQTEILNFSAEKLLFADALHHRECDKTSEPPVYLLSRDTEIFIIITTRLFRKHIPLLVQASVEEEMSISKLRQTLNHLWLFYLMF